MRLIDLELRGDHIALDALLKASGLASSGGEAKSAVTSGRVEVDGQVELRRSRKLRAGAVVAMTGVRVRVRAPVGTATAAAHGGEAPAMPDASNGTAEGASAVASERADAAD